MLRALAYPAFLLLTVGLILYLAFWRGYIADIRSKGSKQRLATNAGISQVVDPKTLRLLGIVKRRHRDDYFLNTPISKRPGSTRVCTLGDSNTYGDEVGDQHHYPAYLQRQLHAAGYRQVEVVNFGHSWYGFSQVYVMWKRVASRYGCDFVVIQPFAFWEVRDTRFNHTKDVVPAYLHARLVLHGAGLRLIEPIGKTVEQRRDNYYRALPRWQYLRYDRHPPSLFSAMLPGNKELPNPFYYTDLSTRAEVVEIYRRIVAEIAAEAPQVLLLLRNDRPYSALPELTRSNPPNVAVTEVRLPARFPYLAPAGHPSSLGHELVATAVFRTLTGRFERNRVEVLSAAPIDPVSAGGTLPLDQYDKVLLRMGNVDMGLVVPAANRRQGSDRFFHRSLRRNSVKGLLIALPAEGGSGDFCMLPLDHVPPGDTAVRLESGKLRSRSLGPLVPNAPHAAVRHAPFKCTSNRHMRMARLVLEQTPATRSDRLSVAAPPIGKLRAGRIRVPLSGLYRGATSRDWLGEIRRLPGTSKLYAVLRRDAEADVLVPLLALNKDEQRLIEFARKPRTTLRRQSP